MLSAYRQDQDGHCPGRTDGVYEEIRQTSKGNLTNMLKEEGKKKPS